MAASFPAPEATRRATAPDQLQDMLHEAMHAPPAPVEAPKDIPMMHVSEGEMQAFKHLAHSIVSRTLAHETEYHRMKRPDLDPKDWKMLKRHNDLSVYKRRIPKQPAQANQARGPTPVKRPMVLCVGSIAGEIEEVLYGLNAKSRDEMQATLAHMSKGHLDCAMLAKLEDGSDADPYRQLALKWILSDTLGDARLLNHRDLCTLESMGFGTDAHGERYGYYLLQSVDFAGCPPPPETSDTVRANMMMCCIYRQVPGTPVVDVYVKGLFDLGGDIPAFLMWNASSSLLLSILGSIEGAEAKRLTLLALQKAESSVSSSFADLSGLDLDDFDLTSDSVPSGYSNSASSLPAEASAAIAAMTPALARILSKSHRKSRSKRQSQAEPCCVCSKKPAASIVGATHRTCGVCFRGVCNKCHIKRKLLARPQPVLVACCKSCLLESKQLAVDPRDPCPVLP